MTILSFLSSSLQMLNVERFFVLKLTNVTNFSCSIVSLLIITFKLHHARMSVVTSAEDALKAANSLFVDENFEGALEQYNLSIELDDTNVDAFLKRSQCHTKLENYTGMHKRKKKSERI